MHIYAQKVKRTEPPVMMRTWLNGPPGHLLVTIATELIEII